jgi:UDP-N-acetylmuramate dehydrogenase
MRFPDSVAHLIQHDYSLAPRLWLGIGGPARYYAEPTSRSELIDLVRAANDQGVQVRVLGGGSNLLARESGIDGLVVSMGATGLSELTVDGNRLTAGAGATLSRAVTHAVGLGLAGMEHLLGIPGTIGGALVTNAGAGGRDIGLVTKSVEVLGRDGEVRTLSTEEAQFSHRRSGLGGEIVLGATFQLESLGLEALTKQMQKLWIIRNAGQPKDQSRIAMPFVDPDGATAQRLIFDIGLCGLREGGASLNAEYPNFLIAQQGTSSNDCLRLIERVREQVLLQTGIDLQTNLQIW